MHALACRSRTPDPPSSPAPGSAVQQSPDEGTYAEAGPWEANVSRFCYLMVVAYDGTDFCGYQLQQGTRGARTVAGELQRMLCTFFQVEASGRTDAGVHAHQQFVQFYLDKSIAALEAVPQRLNRLLPDDLRVRHLCQVSPQFSVRLHATSREYCYNLAWGHVPNPLKRRYQHFVYGDMDVPAMIGALELMVGTWDFGAFSNFRRDGASTVRTVTKARMVMAGPQEAHIEIQGNGFLHKMVRHIVGAVIAVGRGKITQQHLEDLLKQGVPSHIQAGGFRGWRVADACGLHKVNVEFKEGSMDI